VNCHACQCRSNVMVPRACMRAWSARESGLPRLRATGTRAASIVGRGCGSVAWKLQSSSQPHSRTLEHGAWTRYCAIIPLRYVGLVHTIILKQLLCKFRRPRKKKKGSRTYTNPAKDRTRQIRGLRLRTFGTATTNSQIAFRACQRVQGSATPCSRRPPAWRHFRLVPRRVWPLWRANCQRPPPHPSGLRRKPLGPRWTWGIG
jgi:hypothetical protein